MTDAQLAQEIAELLSRATALEEKAATLEETPVVEAAPAGGESVDELRARVDELEELVWGLQHSDPDDGSDLGDVAGLEELVGGPPVSDGVDFDGADADLPDDFTVDDGADADLPDVVVEGDELGDGEKGDGFMPCPKCGGKKADAYADGTARCSEDGSPLHKMAKKDDDGELEFKELDDEPAEPTGDEDLEVKADAEPVVQLDEMELLLARRQSLAVE